MKSVLVIAATTGYQTRTFEEAARALGWHVHMATDRCHRLDDPWGDEAIAVRFDEPQKAAQKLADIEPAPDGIVAVGDRPTSVAAAVASELQLPFHPLEAVEACRNKFVARERMAAAGLLVPEFFLVPLSMPVAEAARSARFPCVLKPLGLSASRGVIRANNEDEFADAFDRITAILQTPELRRNTREENRRIQVESFIPGREFALEGLVTEGRLKTLAIFDKPDPLDGPYFEETIYTTPSRQPEPVQKAIAGTTQQAVAALGMTHGPLHAEMRVNEQGVWMLEVAARPIGGLCSRCLRGEDGSSLEELILRHSTGEDVSGWTREAAASGVMMIPVPANGIFNGCTGTEQALRITGIDDVVITAKQGQRLLRLPEGNTYLGFIFATGETPEAVERALRLSYAKLQFEIAAELPALRP